MLSFTMLLLMMVLLLMVELVMVELKMNELLVMFEMEMVAFRRVLKLMLLPMEEPSVRFVWISVELVTLNLKTVLLRIVDVSIMLEFIVLRLILLLFIKELVILLSRIELFIRVMLMRFARIADAFRKVELRTWVLLRVTFWRMLPYTVLFSSRLFMMVELVILTLKPKTVSRFEALIKLEVMLDDVITELSISVLLMVLWVTVALSMVEFWICPRSIIDSEMELLEMVVL